METAGSILAKLFQAKEEGKSSEEINDLTNKFRQKSIEQLGREEYVSDFSFGENEEETE
jgi:hypothetical protein